ncbi:MAG: hypothetical protein JNM36_11555 [Chitinophagales bacterium]|nr:hypothetical protein [Chitinophagales bacterium]
MKSYFWLFCNAVLFLGILFLYQKGYYTTYRSDRVKQAYWINFKLLDETSTLVFHNNTYANRFVDIYTHERKAVTNAITYWQQAKNILQQDSMFQNHTIALIELLQQNKEHNVAAIAAYQQKILEIIAQKQLQQVFSKTFGDTLREILQQATKADLYVAQTLLSHLNIQNSIKVHHRLEVLESQLLFEKPILYDTFMPHVVLNKEHFKVGDTLRAKIALIGTASKAPVAVSVEDKKIPLQNGLARYRQVCKEVGTFSLGIFLKLRRMPSDSVMITNAAQYQVQTICQ